MTDIKAIIKEVCDIKIIPSSTVEHTDTRGRKYHDRTPEKLEEFKLDKFNILPEKYKEYVLIHLIFFKNINSNQVGSYNTIGLARNLFPENFLHNIFKEYPNIFKNIIEHAIKTKNDMVDYIFQNKKDIYINKKTYLYFEKLAIEYKCMNIIYILNKYHIEDELFNIEEINISDNTEDEDFDTSILKQQNKFMKNEIVKMREEIKSEKEKYASLEDKIKSIFEKS